MIMIRKAKEKDIPELAELYKKVFKVHNIFEKSKDDILSYLKVLLDRCQVIVAFHDKEIAGAAAVHIKVDRKDHKLATIKHVAVKEEYQKKGIGKELMKKAEETVGKGKLEVHLAAQEGPATDFYTKLGFEIEGKLKSHYRKGEDCIILGKILEE